MDHPIMRELRDSLSKSARLQLRKVSDDPNPSVVVTDSELDITTPVDTAADQFGAAPTTPSADDSSTWPQPQSRSPSYNALSNSTEQPGLLTSTPPVIPTNEPGRQDSVLKSLPGESGSGCVKVDGERDVRSESMAAGNFKDARAHYSESPKSEIPFYFIPSALEGDPELIVRIARTDGSGETEIKV